MGRRRRCCHEKGLFLRQRRWPRLQQQQFHGIILTFIEGHSKAATRPTYLQPSRVCNYLVLLLSMTCRCIRTLSTRSKLPPLTGACRRAFLDRPRGHVDKGDHPCRPVMSQIGGKVHSVVYIGARRPSTRVT